MVAQRLYYGLRETTLPRPPFLVNHFASQYDLIWLDVPITPAAATQDILPTAASQYDLRWLDVNFSVAGATQDIIDHSTAEFVLAWLDVDFETEGILPVAPAEYDLTWLDVDIEAAGPTFAILNITPAQYDLRWLDAPLFSELGSGAACVSNGSYLEAPQWPSRNLDRFAMGGWFQVDDTVGGALLTKWVFPGSTEFALLIAGNVAEFSVSVNGSVEFVQDTFPGGTMEVGRWYFLYAERTPTDIAVGIGTADDPPALTRKPVSAGVTNITGAKGVFGVRIVTGGTDLPLNGRFDDWHFWRDIPGMTPAEIWAAGYDDLTTGQKANLASWWKFDDSGLGVWVDSHETFDLDAKPTPTSVPQCGGRPFTSPSTTTCPVSPGRYDLAWLDVTFEVAGTTQTILDVLPAEFELTWLDVMLFGAGGTQDTVLHLAAEYDLTWLDVNFTAGGGTEEILFVDPAQYDIRWLDVPLQSSGPLADTLITTPAEYDLTWLDVSIEVGGFPQTEDMVPHGSSEYDLRWLDVNFSVAGTTQDIIDHAAAEFDLIWIDSAPFDVGGPTEDTIDHGVADYQLSWIDSVQFEVGGPTEAIVDSFPSRYDLTWLDVNINPAGPSLSPGVCFNGTTASYMQRNLPNKQGGQLGFETTTGEGFLSVWTKNENPPDQPNAGFVLGGTGDGDTRLQMGLTANPIDGATFAYFELDDGTAQGTITAQSKTELNLLPGWNHHAFGFDPARINEDGGGWVYWLNGVEVLMELGNLQWPQGGWFSHAQPQAGDRFRHLTVAANMNSGVITDPFGVCMTNMVLRAVKLDQAQVNFWYLGPGQGTLVPEVIFPSGPTANDYAWPLAEPGFGDEVWGDGSVGRDTVGFFTPANPTPELDGILGRGTGATPPDLAP